MPNIKIVVDASNTEIATLMKAFIASELCETIQVTGDASPASHSEGGLYELSDKRASAAPNSPVWKKSGGNRFVTVPIKIKATIDGISKYIHTTALFDPGANINLGKRKILEETGLRGKNETLTLHKSGDISAIQSKLYTIELIDNENKLHSIEVYSQDKAPGYNTKMEKHQLEKMAELFNVPSNQINNCEGEIGIILGIEHFNISPMSHIVKQNEKCFVISRNLDICSPFQNAFSSF